MEASGSLGLTSQLSNLLGALAGQRKTAPEKCHLRLPFVSTYMRTHTHEHPGISRYPVDVLLILRPWPCSSPLPYLSRSFRKGLLNPRRILFKHAPVPHGTSLFLGAAVLLGSPVALIL